MLIMFFIYKEHASARPAGGFSTLRSPQSGVLCTVQGWAAGMLCAPTPLLLLPLDLWKRIAAAVPESCPTLPSTPPPPNKSFLKGGRPTEGSDLWWRGGGAFGGAALLCASVSPSAVGETPNSQRGGGWDVLGRAGQSWESSGQSGLGAPTKSPQIPCKGI